MKTTLTIFALALLTLTAASAHAEHFGVDLKTKGFEDVVVLDDSTRDVVVGGDDGSAATAIFNAVLNARENAANAEPPSLTQRVFAPYMPHYSTSNNLPDVKSVDIQSLLIKRKADVLAAKRFLLSFKIEPIFDLAAKNVGGGMPPVLRDTLSRGALHLVTGGFTNANFWTSDDQTKEVSFKYCWNVDGGNYLNFHGNTGRSRHCLVLSDWKGLNLPVGLFVSDLSKFADPGSAAAMGVRRSTPTLRAGILITPTGRAGGGGNDASEQGRLFVSHDLVIWDTATGDVVAGPFSLEKKSPDVVYATNNCKKTNNGLSVINDPAGNCATLNPTLGAGWTYDAPLL